MPLSQNNSRLKIFLMYVFCIIIDLSTSSPERLYKGLWQVFWLVLPYFGYLPNLIAGSGQVTVILNFPFAGYLSVATSFAGVSELTATGTAPYFQRLPFTNRPWKRYCYTIICVQRYNSFEHKKGIRFSGYPQVYLLRIHQVEYLFNCFISCLYQNQSVAHQS